MAYVSVAEWRPEQVTEWLKGLDNSIVSYIHWFSNNEVNGQQLLNLSPDELTHLGVYKLGHQELILEAVQHLRNFHYELDRENLQLLALKLSCTAHSLYSEIRDQAESSSVPTQIMADVANVIHFVKPLVSWLDRPPFAGQIQYADFKSQLLSLSLKMATSAQRDRFAERPVAEIRTCSSKLAKLADSIVQDITDPMILQPATLDLATIKKKAGEDLDFFLVPSFYGIHQIGDMKLSSSAHQSGKIQQGDEIVQVNYQTVVGWSRKKVLALFEESPNDLLLTLKRRPRHVKMYGQIYMKPYRLPSRKRALPYSRWNENLPSPRPELLTIPHFDITRAVTLPKKIENNNLSLEPSGTSSSSDEEFGQPSDSQSPASMRLYLPKPRASIQRRFTLSGPPRPSAQSEQFWRELQLERSWRSNQNNSQTNNSSVQNVGGQDRNINEIFHLRDKSASLGNSIATASARSTTCVPFTKVRAGSVKFDLTKFDSLKSDSASNNKIIGERKDKEVSDSALITIQSEVNSNKNEISKETGSSKSLVSNSNGNLTITELNKMKRDAFFNNMDCPSPQSESVNKSEAEGSSEKVKRVIENFKSEIIRTKKDISEVNLLISPGKVMELIENFGRKEAEKSKVEFIQPQRPKNIRERNRLDKSCSTPAYDTNENTSFEKDYLDNSLRDFAEAIKKSPERHFLDPNNKCDFHCNESRSNDFEKESHLHEISTKVEWPSEVNFPNKENVCKSATIVKDTSNRPEDDIVHSNSYSNCKQDTQDSYDNGIRVKKNLQSSDTPLVEHKNMNQNQKTCSKEILAGSHSGNKNEEIIKPIPAQRKSKLTPEKPQNANPCPLPPKPRSKPLPFAPEVTFTSFSNSTPPEPPPRPDSTFVKPIKKTEVTLEHIEQNEDTNSEGSSKEKSYLNPSPRKGTLAISSPVSTPSYDFKPLSAALTSPVRKATKSLHTFNPGTSMEKEKPKIGGSTLESLKAMLTLGRKSGNFSSPRSIRKKNAMLAKKRNVSVKEISSFENSGFLWHRNRKGSAIASWTKYYFVLQGSNFYGFKTKESNKADLFIHLTGFTCTLAEEVKSREFSFKIYHTGTVFYFAANSKEDLQQWLDSVNLAISFQDDKSLPETVTYSQTDSETSDTEPEPETCFPTSPKMKKVLGSSPVPKPARSHQNLASDSKKTHEVQKRFGSLKKLSSHKQSTANTSFSGGNESTEVASLDRKYLRFLGQKNSPTPVPTSRFRSYRRMQPPPIIHPKGKTKVKSKNTESSNEISNAQTSREPPRLIRKPLHSSNPSLIHPDMADYRITQERLAEFRRLRNQSGTPEVNRFLGPDHFLTFQDENFRSNRGRQPEMSGFMTLEQFLLCQEEERQRSLRPRERPTHSNEFSRHEQLVPVCGDERHKTKQLNKLRVNPGQSSHGTSNQNLALQSKKTESEKPQVAPRNKAVLPNTSTKLRNVAMYQPPFIPNSASTSNQGEDAIVTAFEMTLDQNRAHQSTLKNHSGENDFSRSVECNRSKNIPTEYPGIEYPPAFEPETYTLQNMLKTRQKKDSEPKK